MEGLGLACLLGIQVYVRLCYSHHMQSAYAMHNIVCVLHVHRLTGHNETVYIMVVTLTHLHSNAS